MKIQLVISVLLALFLCSCGDDEQREPPDIEDPDMQMMDMGDDGEPDADMNAGDDGPALEPGVTITPVGHAMKIGENFRFNVEVLDTDLMVVEPPEITWSVEDDTIIEIDDAGLVRALEEGRSLVTAQWEDFTGTAEVRVIGRFTRVATGDEHTCANTTSGTVLCWGANDQGQLGRDTDSDSPIALIVDTDLELFGLVAGSQHTCGTTNMGEAYCWGANGSGQLGDGTTNSSESPVKVDTMIAFESLYARGNLTCGLDEDFNAHCWGDNSTGQVGIDSMAPSVPRPTMVAGGYSFTSLALGTNHVCGVAGGLICWGDNSLNQLGEASSAPVERAPVVWMAAFDVASGYTHSCAVWQDSTIGCWGTSEGLGSDSTTASSTPIAVQAPAMTQFASVFLGADHGCGVTTTIDNMCWGKNEQGQLGDNTVESRSNAEFILGMPNFVSISSGRDHSCALSQMGDVFCWGANNTGQLGDGTTTDRREPTFAATTNNPAM